MPLRRQDAKGLMPKSCVSSRLGVFAAGRSLLFRLNDPCHLGIKPCGILAGLLDVPGGEKKSIGPITIQVMPLFKGPCEIKFSGEKK